MVKPIDSDKTITFHQGVKADSKTNQSVPSAKTQDVKVSGQSADLLKLVSLSGVPIDDKKRVEEMRNKVQSNNYSVDLDALSSKLIQHGLLNATGE